MNIHITEKETGQRLTISQLPESVKEKTGANFQTYNFINIGEVKMPTGKKARTYSWDGVLPGKSINNLPLVKSTYWLLPKDAIAILTKWEEKKKLLTLTVTTTGINKDVYISSFDPTFEGGNGSVTYSITLIEATETIITVTKKGKKKKSTTAKRAAKKKKKKYHKVKKTDTLWSIAQKYYKKGSLYKKIYKANKKKIDKKNKGKKVSKYTIWVGMKLYIPKR
jgi:LysM repeat protein